jgi:hypothetical protein
MPNTRTTTARSVFATTLMLATLAVSPLDAGVALAKEVPVVAPDYGPAPDWARYRELGEAAVKTLLTDPDSAKFEWPTGYIQTRYATGRRTYADGYLACGLVNSRNRMGGYGGRMPFLVVIDHDQVLFVDAAPDFTYPMGQFCKNTQFPAPGQMLETHALQENLGFGFTVFAYKDGAYVYRVRAGGPAAQAGLEMNMIIASINGIAVKGLSDAMLNQMFDAAQGAVTLTLTDGKTMTIPRGVVPPEPPMPDRADPEAHP